MEKIKFYSTSECVTFTNDKIDYYLTENFQLEYKQTKVSNRESHTNLKFKTKFNLASTCV